MLRLKRLQKVAKIWSWRPWKQRNVVLSERVMPLIDDDALKIRSSTVSASDLFWALSTTKPVGGMMACNTQVISILHEIIRHNWSLLVQFCRLEFIKLPTVLLATVVSMCVSFRCLCLCEFLTQFLTPLWIFDTRTHRLTTNILYVVVECHSSGLPIFIEQ